MFDYKYYEFDRRNLDFRAKLHRGAYLYRLASILHCGRDEILTGNGPANSAANGRFNVAQQRISYCANNVLVCIAEVLYHMYRKALERIEHNPKEPHLIREALVDKRALAIFRVDDISDLVYIDAEDVKAVYDPLMSGTKVVFPDPHYRFLQDFSNTIRSDKRRGAFYPSARHSQDICIGLFEDQTRLIQPAPYYVINVDLHLLAEDQKVQDPAKLCTDKDKLHPTMGYYSFADVKELENASRGGVLNPSNLPASGKVDFVRRYYKAYPDEAIWHC
jgi:hypothetical protein